MEEVGKVASKSCCVVRGQDPRRRCTFVEGRDLFGKLLL